jgi:phosphonate transport system substrate-binding protein
MTAALPEEIVFGIISTAPAAQVLLEAICQELERQSARKVRPKILRSYRDLGDAMVDGTVHIAWAPPLLAIELENEGAASVVLCSSRGGNTAFEAALFTKSGSAVKKLEDMAGKRIAWVDKSSSAGYLVPRLKIAASGLDPASLFSEETFRRTHEAVAACVLTGEADVGATYVSRDAETKAIVGAGWFEAGASSDEVEIIASAGPIPADAIALSSQIEGDLAESLTRELTTMGETAPNLIKGLLNADRFERVVGGHFDELRRMVKDAAAR